jgi:hypothetical protein
MSDNEQKMNDNDGAVCSLTMVFQESVTLHPVGDDEEGDDEEGDDEAGDDEEGDDEEGDRGIKVCSKLASGGVKITGTTGKGLTCHNGWYFVNMMAEMMGNGVDEVVAEAFVKMMKDLPDLSKLDKEFVAVDELVSLRFTARPLKKPASNTTSASSIFLNALSTTDIRSGASAIAKKDLKELLTVWDKLVVTEEEFNRQKDSDEMSIDFNDAMDRVVSVGRDKEQLVKLGCDFFGFVDTSDMESMKSVFAFGRVINIIYSLPNTTWEDIVVYFKNSPSKSGKIGLAIRTFQNYERFYRFTAKYVRILRIKTNYTVIIRSITALEVYFDKDSTARAKWSKIDV